MTPHDLHRLVKHIGVSADKLIKLYSKSDLNDDDYESNWINLSYGRRKIGLRKKRDGTCIFLSANRKCNAYEARPISCRIFPIDIILDEENNITDLDISDVVSDKFIKCKYYYGKSISYRNFRPKAIQSRDETESYWKKIEQWNRKTENGGKHAFLSFLGFKIR